MSSLRRSPVSRLMNPDTGRSDCSPDERQLVGRSANRSLIHQLRLSDSTWSRFLSIFPHPAGLTSTAASSAYAFERISMEVSINSARTSNRSEREFSCLLNSCPTVKVDSKFVGSPRSLCVKHDLGRYSATETDFANL